MTCIPSEFADLWVTILKSEGNTGHIGVIAHKQPVLEKNLRSAVEESNFCELRSSCTLTAISEDEQWVYATYTDASGAEKKIRSKFLAAADGKTGFTRKMYLEPKGIQMEWAEKYKLTLSEAPRFSVLTRTQVEISRNMGCPELEDTAAFAEKSPYVPALGSGIYPGGRLRSFLPNRLSLPLQ